MENKKLSEMVEDIVAENAALKKENDRLRKQNDKLTENLHRFAPGTLVVGDMKGIEIEEKE